MVNCAVYGCSNRSKNKPNDENFQPLGFYVVPKVKEGQCLRTAELSSRRRALWLSRIRRKDLDELATHYRVCGAHFITGRPAYLMDEANPDWAPSLNLGYKSTTHAGRSASDRYMRLKQRRRASSAANAFELRQRPESASTNAAPIAAGTAAEEISFSDEESPSSEQTAMQHLVGHASPEEPSCLECPVLQENLATAQCHLQAYLQNNQASACMIDKEVTADLLSAHISSLEEENHRLQHDLDIARSRLAKAAPGDRDVLRSNPDMVVFYTGLPNYAVLEAVYILVEPHVRHTLRNRLSKFQEMVVFLMRLRLNVPLQDLAYRYFILGNSHTYIHL
ncbi:uncharacterized protein [Dermacentor andersoni]|uniref:uncharacterized protein n=1 Tax=Dermacentor andersoni TaxID=34620 RepID=UPI003B3B2B9C